VIEEPRVAALEDRGDEQVLDVERHSASNGFPTTPNELRQRDEARIGCSAVLDPHMGTAEVSAAVVHHGPKRHLRRIDEPFWPAASPEHSLSFLLGSKKEVIGEDSSL
jgi:hypothetical protein